PTVIEMIRPRIEEKLPRDLKLLVIMVMYCSLRDAVNLVNTNVILKPFADEHVGWTLSGVSHFLRGHLRVLCSKVNSPETLQTNLINFYN
ncbi:MAG: hypothetical protein QXZ33_05300, partial [Metallosphaera sp.]